MARKVKGCGTIVKIDTGDAGGFVVQGHCDSVTPFGQAKAIISTPTLDCDLTDEVGREEQSTMEFEQFWDPTDDDQLRLDTNWEDSKTDPNIVDVAVQLITPSVPDGSGGTNVVTHEADCQIVSLTHPAVTPDGHYKRTVQLLRNSAITKTTVNTP